MKTGKYAYKNHVFKFYIIRRVMTKDNLKNKLYLEADFKEQVRQRRMHWKS